MNLINRRTRVWITLLAVVGMLTPSDAQAIFDCLQKRRDATAALYGSTVCTPAGQQLVCNYIPQTCYRAQAVTVPVTTYRPVTSCDPCTGCQTVCMRPQICYQQQVKYTPYATYRLQYSLAQPACGTPATTYYAPATGYAAPATFAAPATGCSSCNAGVATTSYYAPTATYAAPVYGSTAQPNIAYTYPSSTAAVSGYNYGTPATGAVAGTTYSAAPGYSNGAALYGNASPTMVSPSYAAPALSTPAYAGTTYAAPSYAAPNYSVPTNPAPTYAAPTYSAPTSAPAYSSGTPTGTPTLANPAPALSGSAVLGAPSTSAIVSGGSLTPVPSSTFSTPAGSSLGSTTQGSGPTGSSTSAYPAQPATNNPTVKSPYSSGVTPSTGMPTPPPSLQSPVNTPTPAVVPQPAQQPIPDPEMQRGPRIGSPTSMPHLIDPEDKTAAAWPTRRVWGYREVTLHTTGYGDRSADVVQTAAFAPAAALPLVTRDESPRVAATEGAARLGMPQPAMIITPAAPAVDHDGWRSSSR